ncbi:hypothetical protein ACN28I_45895 [Archangium gephyra]|uniref:hypothetical protein n=1 Tax=Archangium gephyra TaxID=48 RepID=UPI003B7B905A
MSNAPMQDEQIQPLDTRRRAAAAGKRGSLRAMGPITGAIASAAATVGSRALGLGAAGFVLGIVAFFVEKLTGLLEYPSEHWGVIVYGLLPVYMAAGAIGLGTAGLWRGIGRVAMNLVQQHKLCQRIVERVFERAASLADGASTPDILHKPLPIQKLRELLSQAITAYATSDDDETGLKGFSRSIFRRLKLRVCLQMETKLIELIGEEARDQSTVELTLDRLQELAEEKLDERVMDALDGARNQQAFVWGGLFAAVLALPPIALALLR